jgi:hypothetical protein
MIDLEEFTKAFRLICSRFGREFVTEQAGAYLRFLNDTTDTGDDRRDTEAFLAAARAVWATSKFFPRPADFLTVLAGGEWTVVLELIEKARRREAWSDEWRGQLTQRGRDACLKLGGVPGMVAMVDRDLIRTKAAWEEAYEQATTTAALALPKPARPERALPASGGLASVTEILPGVQSRAPGPRAAQPAPAPRHGLSVERGGQR